MGQQKHQLVQMYNHQFTAAKEFYQELSSRRQCVLSSGWWWPCANYCPLQITLLSPQPLMISRLYPGQALAADPPWRQAGGSWCGLAVVVACAGYIWILGTESNSLSSSRSLRQPSIWYFLPSDPAELSWEKREREERGNCRPGLQDTRRLMGLSPPPPPNPGWIRTIVSSLRSFCFSIRRLFLFASFSVWIITLSHCSGCMQWKDFLDDIELSQILINLLRIVCLISHGIIWLCWLLGQAHCHWGPGLSALSWSPDPLESVLFWDRGEVFSPVRLGSGGIRPSFIRFFCFILRFWNQIFTWKRGKG